MSSRIESVLSYILTACAIVFAGTFVHREFFGAPLRSASSEVGSPIFVKDWKSIANRGRRIGKMESPVIIVEFADLECPFCKKFHEQTLPKIKEAFSDKVSLSYVHFPITGHRFANPAARAAECAGDRGRFGPFIDAVYRRQDSLGLKSWASFAQDAGIHDTVAFQRCATAVTSLAYVDSGQADGKRIGVVGTPGIMINGWLFAHPPSDSVLKRTIDSIVNRPASR